jgi:DNA-directed RNA polymerase specialized sigma24 family protein
MDDRTIPDERFRQFALHSWFAGLAPDPADLVACVVERFRRATPSPSEREHPGLLICRVGLEVLAELPDDATPGLCAELPACDGSERQLLELALQRIPPRDRAAILLHHHTVAGSPELDPDDVDERITGPLSRSTALLHAAIEELRAKHRVAPRGT